MASPSIWGTPAVVAAPTPYPAPDARRGISRKLSLHTYRKNDYFPLKAKRKRFRARFVPDAEPFPFGLERNKKKYGCTAIANLSYFLVREKDSDYQLLKPCNSGKQYLYQITLVSLKSVMVSLIFGTN